MIKEKYIVIIGSNGLIGRTIVKELILKYDCKVLAVDFASLDDEFDEVIKTGKFSFYKCDITNEFDVQELLNKVREDSCTVDCLINTSYPRNSNYGNKLFDVKVSDFNENLSLNLGSHFLLMQQFSKYFTEKGCGNIINFSSVYGHVAPDFSIYEGEDFTMPVEYAVIKSGLNHLNRYMAKYLGSKNIRFNIISPGGILNGHSDRFIKAYGSKCLTKGMLSPNDLVGLVAFLISDISKYINGQTIIVDDGFTL